MRIIHISDLHLCRDFKRNNISKVKRLIKHISELGIDHLVITGDISDNANVKDFLILKRILQAFNLYSREKTTIIPGNHDIFGGVQKPEDIPNFPSKCKKVNYKEKIFLFVEHFKELFEGCYFPNDGEYFPFAKPIDNVLFVGLNSTDRYSRLGNPLASNGKVDDKQRGGLIEILSAKSFEPYKKIILTHHHFYRNCDEVKSSESAIWNKIEKFTMKLKKKKKLMKIFIEHNIELVLHGHSHDMREYSRKEITFLNAGNSITGNPSNEFQLFLIDICKGEINKSILQPGRKRPQITKFSVPEYQPA